MVGSCGNWVGLWLEAIELWGEAAVVVGRRSTKLASGGTAAWREAQTMVTEKAVAGMELTLALASGRLGHTAETVTRSALRDVHGRVRANRKRLSRR